MKVSGSAHRARAEGRRAEWWLDALDRGKVDRMADVWLALDKETDNKVRWTADVDGVTFSLYVPKWRVPEPWPSRIRVTVGPDSSETLPSLSRVAAAGTPNLRRRPISARVAFVEDMTKTIRYAPTQRSPDEELGEPYVPKALTVGGADRLVVKVAWG